MKYTARRFLRFNLKRGGGIIYLLTNKRTKKKVDAKNSLNLRSSKKMNWYRDS